MQWSFPIGTVKGTSIRVHVTFFLLLAWVAGSGWVAGGYQAAIQNLVFITLLFACVLLHEFGHVFAARRYGVKTPDITLLPIGGVARLERIPEKPSQELVIALAGPAVNVVIAVVLLLLLGGRLSTGSMEVQNSSVDLLARLAAVNIFLVIFNLIPAFPMDGGRVLRALLAGWLGYARGTRVAATVGQVIAFGFGFAGLFGNPLLLFIALFVYLGATAEAHVAQIRDVTRGLLARDAMIRKFEVLQPASRVEDAVRRLLSTSQHEFPIVDNAGIMRGLIARDDIIRALREGSSGAPVTEIMRTDIPTVGEGQCLRDALETMQQQVTPAVAVVDVNGRLTGIITPEHIGELIMVLTADDTRRWTAGRGSQQSSTTDGPWGPFVASGRRDS